MLFMLRGIVIKSTYQDAGVYIMQNVRVGWWGKMAAGEKIEDVEGMEK